MSLYWSKCIDQTVSTMIAQMFKCLLSINRNDEAPRKLNDKKCVLGGGVGTSRFLSKMHTVYCCTFQKAVTVIAKQKL